MKSLITGVPGSGKSTLTAELNLQAEMLAYDADEIIGRWENDKWEPIAPPKSIDSTSLIQIFYNWHHEALLRLLEAKAKDVVLLGASRNQDGFYKYFDNLFLLSIGHEELTHRLEARNVGFGHTAEEQDLVLGWNKDFESRAIAKGAVVLNASLPTAEIADEVMEYLHPTRSIFPIKLPGVSIIPDVSLAPGIALGEAS